MSAQEVVAQELHTTGVMFACHALELVRPRLARRGILRVSDLGGARAGDVVRVGGLVICRQRPPTAHGMLFLTLEDETGLVNAAATPQTFDRLRRELGRAPALVVRGKVEREGTAVSLLVLEASELGVTGDG
jgi:error-prone DNA polymerase